MFDSINNRGLRILLHSSLKKASILYPSVNFDFSFCISNIGTDAGRYCIQSNTIYLNNKLFRKLSLSIHAQNIFIHELGHFLNVRLDGVNYLSKNGVHNRKWINYCLSLGASSILSHHSLNL